MEETTPSTFMGQYMVTSTGLSFVMEKTAVVMMKIVTWMKKIKMMKTMAMKTMEMKMAM